MEKNKTLFGKMNYLLMIAGVLLLLIGLFVMSLDKDDYGFGSLGLTVGPLIVLLGFAVEFVAIFLKPKSKE